MDYIIKNISSLPHVTFKGREINIKPRIKAVVLSTNAVNGYWHYITMGFIEEFIKMLSNAHPEFLAIEPIVHQTNSSYPFNINGVTIEWEEDNGIH